MTLQQYLNDVWHKDSVKDLDVIAIGYILQNANGDTNDCCIAEEMIQELDNEIWLEFAALNNLPVNMTSLEYWRSDFYAKRFKVSKYD